MPYPQIKRWEESATLPVVDVPFVWNARRPHPGAASLSDGAVHRTRSRRERLRKRTAAIHGLRISLLLILLVGWVYAEMNGLGTGAHGGTCTEIGHAIGPTLKQRIEKSIGTRSADRGPPNSLSMKVCDPSLVAMLPTLEAQIGQMPELEKMAKKLWKGDSAGAGTRSLLTSVLANEGL